MTIQKFISALEHNGINLQFNQASTGYVSGVSYGYNGFLVTGSKLGNDFKWTTIRNKLDYNQERDRAAIHEANLKTKAPHVCNEGAQAKRSLEVDYYHNFRSDHPLFETVKNSDLLRSDLIDGDHQPNFDHEGFVAKRKRRKKRKGRRL